MCKASAKNTAPRAKTHPYYKVGFFWMFLINGHYKDNINPVLRLLQEKIQTQFVFFNCQPHF